MLPRCNHARPDPRQQAGRTNQSDNGTTESLRLQIVQRSLVVSMQLFEVPTWVLQHDAKRRRLELVLVQQVGPPPSAFEMRNLVADTALTDSSPQEVAAEATKPTLPACPSTGAPDRLLDRRACRIPTPDTGDESRLPSCLRFPDATPLMERDFRRP